MTTKPIVTDHTETIRTLRYRLFTLYETFEDYVVNKGEDPSTIYSITAARKAWAETSSPEELRKMMPMPKAARKEV